MTVLGARQSSSGSCSEAPRGIASEGLLKFRWNSLPVCLTVGFTWLCNNSEFLQWLSPLPWNKIIAIPLRNTVGKRHNAACCSEASLVRMTSSNCRGTGPCTGDAGGSEDASRASSLCWSSGLVPFGGCRRKQLVYTPVLAPSCTCFIFEQLCFLSFFPQGFCIQSTNIVT